MLAHGIGIIVIIMFYLRGYRWQTSLSISEQFGGKVKAMANKGTNANKGQWFQRFVANSISSMSGEVSDITIQGYLRSASQLEDIWQQLDDNVNALITEGTAPWDAYSKVAYALGLIRACRINVVFVQGLLKANALVNPATANYLPRLSYEQALALCQHIEPLIEESLKASANLAYVPMGYNLPLAFGPRVRPSDQHLPLAHVRGFIEAAQQTRDWAAGLLAQYELALNAPKKQVPQPIATHLAQMKRELELGDFHLRSGVDMTGSISSGQQVPDELSTKAEDLLWEAVESFFKVSQLVAFPVVPLLHTQQPPLPSDMRGQGRQEHPYQERHIVPHQPATTPAQTYTSAPQEPPPPNIYDLFNQVTSTPGAVQPISTPPTSGTSNLLDQITASPETSPKVSPTPSPELSAMFNQVTANSESAPRVSHSSSTSPDISNVSDMFNQVINAQQTEQQMLTQSVQPVQPTQPPKRTAHTSQTSKAISQDNTLDLLSEICGEQNTHE